MHEEEQTPYFSPGFALNGSTMHRDKKLQRDSRLSNHESETGDRGFDRQATFMPASKESMTSLVEARESAEFGKPEPLNYELALPFERKE